jgi:neutral ceramidase
VVYSMHPTVLHEDSTLISADFPGMTRKYLQGEVLGPDCPVLYHTGPAGNQSPRYSTAANTFPEAEKLGRMLGKAIAKSISRIHYITPVSITCRQEFLELPPRSLPSVKQAQATLELAKARLTQLRAAGAPRPVVRTAEVDWFGAQETLTLARAEADKRLNPAIEASMPAEIQMTKIGPWAFVGWQGEMFVEYALAVKARAKNTYLISLANGELQGYIATEKAAAERAYEAECALFAPASGTVLVNKTLEMLAA